MLKSQKGAAAIILAMLCVVIVTVIIAILPKVVSDYAEDSRKFFVMTETLKIMEDLALLTQNARQAALSNGNSDGTGNCPADSPNEVIIDRTNNDAGGTNTKEAFCFPDNNDMTCFLDPVERDDVNFCLAPGAMTAKHDPFATLKWVPQRTKFQELIARVKAHIYQTAITLAKKVAQSPFAMAAPTYLPPDPNGAQAVSMQATVCDGTQARNHNYCESCRHSNATCVRLAICNPLAESGTCDQVPRDYFTQRIIIYNGGATVP